MPNSEPYEAETLLGISSHLAYEVQMMARCSALMAQSPSSGDLLQPSYFEYMQTIKNAVLEAFLIHHRNVYEFLLPSSPREDTVAAIHYFAAPSEWKTKAESLKTLTLVEGKQRVNKQLTHMTENRVKPAENVSDVGFAMFGWSHQTIVADLVSALHAFVDSVPDSTLVKPLTAVL